MQFITTGKHLLYEKAIDLQIFIEYNMTNLYTQCTKHTINGEQPTFICYQYTSVQALKRLHTENVQENPTETIYQ